MHISGFQGLGLPAAFFGRQAWRSAALTGGVLLALAVSADVPYSVANASATVTDGAASTMNFQIGSSSTANSAVTIGYATVDGTAVNGTDYTGAIGTVTIPAGSATAGVPPIAVDGESGDGPSKQFSLQLLGVGGTGSIPSFSAPATFSMGSGAAGGGGLPIAVADFDGNGTPDLALSSLGTVAVLLNNTPTGAASPSFGLAADFTVVPASESAGKVASLAAADFNGDGKPDLAAVMGGQTVAVLLNTTASGAATASFAPATFISGQEGVAADFNGDGLPDLVGVSADGLGFLLNTTARNGTTATFEYFDYPLSTPSNRSLSSIVTGDFNGDGKPDLAIALSVIPTSGTGCSVEILLNSTAAGATFPSFSAPASFGALGKECQSLVVTDFNGDGKADLLMLGSGGGASLLFNTTSTGAATPSFTAPPVNSTGNFDTPLGAGDFNGDGKAELVATNQLPPYENDFSLDVLTNVSAFDTNSVAFTLPISIVDSPQVGNVQAIAIADFNGDGQPDLVATGSTSAYMEVLLNTTPPAAALQAGTGNVSATGTINYDSDIPNPFSFTPVNNAALNTLYTSNSITISGTNVASAISISGGQYSIDGGAYTGASGTVQPASSVTVQVLSSSSYFTGTQATLTIGGVSAAFTVNTESAGGSSGGSSGGSGSSSGSSGSSSSSSGASGATSSSGSGSSGSGSSSSGSSSGSSSSGGGSSGGGAMNPALLLLLGLARARRGRRRAATGR